MISTKGRYALRVMIDLAENEEQGNIPLRSIAERQEISKKYLEILVKELVSSGLVKGHSGKGGGYRLCRKAEKYTVLEILEVMEGRLAPVACLECNAAVCPRESDCKTLPMWKDFDRMTRDFFANRTLRDLLEHSQNRQ